MCPNSGGGECLGTLTAGTYRTTTFALPVTYTVPNRWQNLEDLPGNFLLVPPDQDVAGVDAGTSDYVGVGLRAVAASRDCSSEVEATQPQPGVGSTPQAIADELRARPGLVVTAPRNVGVGGLTGVVIDVRIDEAWTGTCFYSEGAPVVPLIKGMPPSSFDHSMIEGIATRLYLLARDAGTLDIEIQLVNPTRLDEYASVAESFSFGD